MSDEADEAFDELVAGWMAFYESGGAPSLTDWDGCGADDRAAMREASRRVVAHEISALARALTDPQFAMLLSQPSPDEINEVAAAAMRAGLRASRNEVSHATDAGR
jgi:hypothetical protein